MLTTRELIAGIKQDYAISFDPMRLLRYLDRIQRMVFLDETFELTYFNGDDPTFPYPILPTVAGQRSYTIEDGVLTDTEGNPLDITFEGNPADVSRVFFVFSSGGHNDIRLGERGYGLNYYGTDDRSFMLRDRWYHKEVVILHQRTPNSKPTIQFARDPKDTDQRYYVSMGLVPKPLTSLSSTLTLNVDRWERALIDGVVGECERAVNAGESKKADKFENEWIPAIRSSYNESQNEFVDSTVTRKRFG